MVLGGFRSFHVLVTTSVRQETTKRLNRGTYRASDHPKGKVSFSPNAVWSLLRREL